MSKGNVITFYSYKGGIGRTFALANIGVMLSLWGYKVLCVDWDLEAPGLDSYFRKWLGDADRPGLAELIENFRDLKGKDKKLHWQNHLIPVEISGKMAALHLISAGIQDETYIDRIQNLNWPQLYKKKNLGAHIESMRNEWKDAYDFVLVDSRTGITDIGGICTVQLPDILVGMFTANAQSLYGAKYVLERAKVNHNNFLYDRVNLLVLPVASRFSEEIKYAFAQDWIPEFIKTMAPFYADWLPQSVTLQTILKHTLIASRPYWSFGERLPVIEAGVPNYLSHTFETLAALLAHQLVDTNRLIKNRRIYIQEIIKNVSIKESDLSIDFKNIDKLLNEGEVVMAVGLGKIYMDSKNYDMAIEVFKYILSKMSQNLRDYYIPLGNLAYAFRHKGDYKKAIETLTKVKRFRKGKFFHPWHAVALAYCYLKLGDQDLYEKWLSEAKKSPAYEEKIPEFTRLYPEIKADLPITASNLQAPSAR